MLKVILEYTGENIEEILKSFLKKMLSFVKSLGNFRNLL